MEFYRALQDTKRPHLFIWGQAGHGQRPIMPHNGGERIMPIDIRVDQSLPAFTNCSLDQNPGNGDPADGDLQGQVNAFLYWDTPTIIDEVDRWEMTIGLTDKAPQQATTVDITPRRLQKFYANPGQTVHWSNVSLQDGKTIQSGYATADRMGLITLDKIHVGKGKNRISIGK